MGFSTQSVASVNLQTFVAINFSYNRNYTMSYTIDSGYQAHFVM